MDSGRAGVWDSEDAFSEVFLGYFEDLGIIEGVLEWLSATTVCSAC